MKKHFILTALFACTIFVKIQSQTLVSAERQTPGFGFEKIQRKAEHQSGGFNARGYGDGRDDRGDCDQCRKWKKSKKHGACHRPGKHYGKHKHRGKHEGSCHNSCCESRRNRDCDDKDRWNGRNGHGQRDNDRWDNRNERDRRDENNRRFTSTRSDRDDQYRGSSRSSQRKAVSTGMVKTNRPGVARRAGSRP